VPCSPTQSPVFQYSIPSLSSCHGWWVCPQKMRSAPSCAACLSAPSQTLRSSRSQCVCSLSSRRGSHFFRVSTFWSQRYSGVNTLPRSGAPLAQRLSYWCPWMAMHFLPFHSQAYSL